MNYKIDNIIYYWKVLCQTCFWIFSNKLVSVGIFMKSITRFGEKIEYIKLEDFLIHDTRISYVKQHVLRCWFASGFFQNEFQLSHIRRENQRPIKVIILNFNSIKCKKRSCFIVSSKQRHHNIVVFLTSIFILV